MKLSYGAVQTHVIPKVQLKENDYIEDSAQEKVNLAIWELLHPTMLLIFISGSLLTFIHV